MPQKQYANLVLKLANQIRREFNLITEKNGTQTRILYFLFNNDLCREIYQKDIEEALNIKSASLSVQLKKLEKKNVIVRKKVFGDDRLKEVCLTPEGIALKDKTNKEIHFLEDTLTEGISESDLAVFGNVVRKMIENISFKKRIQGRMEDKNEKVQHESRKSHF